MNTIPTIFNEKITAYTAVGNKERAAATGISAVILNRPGLARRTFLQDIEKTGFDNVISIESRAPHYDIEELSQKFPFVRFILPEKELNLGEQINLAASEVQSPLFFVIYSDMKIIAGGNARRMAERLSVAGEEDEKKEKEAGFKRICTVPVIMNSNYESLPTIASPVTQKRKMKTVLLEPHAEGELSLYPFNGIGIYDRQRFIMTGGFDITLGSSHWQLMDFGFRSWLWGEEIALSLQLKLSCDAEMPSEDYTVEKSYMRYYLKNIAPVFRGDHAHLPLYMFPSYLNKSGEDFFASWEEFKETRKWIKTNKFRWKTDARGITSRWETT